MANGTFRSSRCVAPRSWDVAALPVRADVSFHFALNTELLMNFEVEPGWKAIPRKTPADLAKFHLTQKNRATNLLA